MIKHFIQGLRLAGLFLFAVLTMAAPTAVHADIYTKDGPDFGCLKTNFTDGGSFVVMGVSNQCSVQERVAVCFTWAGDDSTQPGIWQTFGDFSPGIGGFQRGGSIDNKPEDSAWLVNVTVCNAGTVCQAPCPGTFASTVTQPAPDPSSDTPTHTSTDTADNQTSTDSTASDDSAMADDNSSSDDNSSQQADASSDNASSDDSSSDDQTLQDVQQGLQQSEQSTQTMMDAIKQIGSKSSSDDSGSGSNEDKSGISDRCGREAGDPNFDKPC